MVEEILTHAENKNFLQFSKLANQIISERINMVVESIKPHIVAESLGLVLNEEDVSLED